MEEGKKWFTISEAGFSSDRNASHRRVMEDAHCIADKLEQDESVGFFGVYDGHGGKTAAVFCQTYLHKEFFKLLKEVTEFEDEQIMKNLLQTCYTNVDEAMKETVPSAGACVVTAAIKRVGEKRILYVANAGDSRAILSRNGVASRLTVDHKPSTCLEDVERLATLNPPGFISDDRVNGMLGITRAMGDHNMKRVGYIRNDIHFSMVTLEPSDDFLILACDGVWDVIEDQGAVDLIRNQELVDCTTKAKHLLVSAKKGGSTDNLTVIVIRL